MIQKFKLLIHLARLINNTPMWTQRILVWITYYIYYLKTLNYLLKSEFIFFNSLWWRKKSFNYKHWWNQYCESTIWYWTQVSNAGLITYFGNFVFGFSSLRLSDFLYNIFYLQGKMDKTKWKINKLLRNILVLLLPNTTKNEVTKMRSVSQILLIVFFPHLFWQTLFIPRCFDLKCQQGSDLHISDN
jgi:hypothetical protein